MTVVGDGEVLVVNQVNHTSSMADITPTSCPKLVCNSCVIVLFGGVFVLSLWLFYNFCRKMSLCRTCKTGSDPFLFFLLKTFMLLK